MIKSLREDWDHRYKAIKYVILALGSTETVINKRSGYVKFKPIDRWTNNELMELLNPILIKIGLDTWSYEFFQGEYHILYIGR